DNSDVNQPWRPGQIITFRGRSEKVCQLTGMMDREQHRLAPARTDAQGLWATDLGYPVDDGKQLSFLFGDSRPTGRHLPYPESPPDDAFAWTTDRDPPTTDRCLALAVNHRTVGPDFSVTVPPVVVGSKEPILQGYFDVPSSGFVTDEGLHAFFWTDHCSFP